MSRTAALLLVIAMIAGVPATAVNVATPQGAVDVFARGDLFDLVALLRLTGAQVAFAPAAGSYTASLNSHEVQFTPGGSLAVVDGRLTPLPGPVRSLEGHVVGAVTTAAALLEPLGWSLTGGAEQPRLVPLAAGERIALDLVPSASGTLVVIRGTSQKPRMIAVPGQVTLQFGSPLELTSPPPRQGELLGVDLHENTLTLRLAPGVEVASTYSLADPPRYVVRLGSAGAEARGELASRTGPLVVVDPGHGGEDQGARGPGGEQEKDITLAVSRLIVQRLQVAGITARLTREGDDTLALVDRTALANRLKADVFVSVHLNASPAKGARGAETYFMNADATDSQAAQAAARENASASGDGLQLILWDLAHVANLDASSRLAGAIQSQLNALHGITDRGIKQAPFVVLTGATMPAALVEVGFLSNPDEAQRLLTPEFQDEIATAVAQAIVSFIRSPQAANTPPPGPTP
jgi:N-acetylmuramoyl-L-alanine amidase